MAWLHEVNADATCAVVVSHDCDLANENLDVEPDVEVIVGRTIEKADGNFTWAKAPRTLHYGAMRNGVQTIIELVDHLVFRILDQFQIPHSQATRWKGEQMGES